MLNFLSLMRIGVELPKYSPYNERTLEGTKAPIKLNGILLDWCWYPLEYDLERRVFFGLVQGYENEMGSFLLDEILQVGLYVDETYIPKTLKELLNER